MGKVTITFTATNYDDLSDVARNRTKRKPRSVQADALVDTGATRLYLQNRVIEALGLRAMGQITSRTMSDRAEKRIVYSPVQLEIQFKAAMACSMLCHCPTPCRILLGRFRWTTWIGWWTCDEENSFQTQSTNTANSRTSSENAQHVNRKT